ncbi:MAG: hypothetical protein VZR54_02350 [Ruminococcus sp.]|jgi:hypothetical protein|nr:hypothetical protein [Ruminococcus sp.]
MKERKALYLVALTLFVLSFFSLVTAMILHAVLGDNQLFTVFFAAGAGFASFIGIIFACLSKTKKKS